MQNIIKSISRMELWKWCRKLIKMQANIQWVQVQTVQLLLVQGLHVQIQVEQAGPVLLAREKHSQVLPEQRLHVPLIGVPIQAGQEVQRY